MGWKESERKRSWPDRRLYFFVGDTEKVINHIMSDGWPET
jgi:hypothetical protein